MIEKTATVTEVVSDTGISRQSIQAWVKKGKVESYMGFVGDRPTRHIIIESMIKKVKSLREKAQKEHQELDIGVSRLQRRLDNE